MNSLWSLRALATRAYKKCGRPVPEGYLPPPLQKVVEEFFFFFPNTDQPRCQEIVAFAKQVQTAVNQPCVIGGGFATFMCENTKFYGDIDMYTVIANKDDALDQVVNALHDTLPGLSEFRLCRSYNRAPNLPPLNVIKMKSPTGDKMIDLVLVIESDPQQLAYLHSNWIALGERITQTFDLEITKCVGFPMRDGGFMFTSFCTDVNQIFTLNDHRLTTALANFSTCSRAFREFLSSLSISEANSPMLKLFLSRHLFSSPYLFVQFQTFWRRVRKYTKRTLRYPRAKNITSLQTLLL